MIEDQILRVLAGSPDAAERLNELADEFRLGRDIGELVPVLDSENSELVAIGAWILGELKLTQHDSVDVIRRLTVLTDHDDASVRFNALSALFPVLKPEDSTTKALLDKLSHDSNEGVRRGAEAALVQLYRR